MISYVISLHNIVSKKKFYSYQMDCNEIVTAISFSLGYNVWTVTINWPGTATKIFTSPEITYDPPCSFWLTHSVKRVRIRSYSGLHFSWIFPHLDWIRRVSLYSVRMRENPRKIQSRITPNTDSFYGLTIA